MCHCVKLNKRTSISSSQNVDISRVWWCSNFDLSVSLIEQYGYELYIVVGTGVLDCPLKNKVAFIEYREANSLPYGV